MPLNAPQCTSMPLDLPPPLICTQERYSSGGFVRHCFVHSVPASHFVAVLSLQCSWPLLHLYSAPASFLASCLYLCFPCNIQTPSGSHDATQQPPYSCPCCFGFSVSFLSRPEQ